MTLTGGVDGYSGNKTYSAIRYDLFWGLDWGKGNKKKYKNKHSELDGKFDTKSTSTKAHGLVSESGPDNSPLKAEINTDISFGRNKIPRLLPHDLEVGGFELEISDMRSLLRPRGLSLEQNFVITDPMTRGPGRSDGNKQTPDGPVLGPHTYTLQLQIHLVQPSSMH
ncbi:hypothetical protein BCR34DRAFT_663745 [Clohesyomyces aquaticus]|uniref:Uncharacterized protein n=1 Tax=Clohesyomyces aquaticus TaxID=1231657 RepID=A0A1Y1ZQH6_9PLEO|nr:hypothetical protein BCR34DRAFT_663745 [Clohesyomyces aquaticus]